MFENNYNESLEMHIKQVLKFSKDKRFIYNIKTRIFNGDDSSIKDFVNSRNDSTHNGKNTIQQRVAI